MKRQLIEKVFITANKQTKKLNFTYIYGNQNKYYEISIFIYQKIITKMFNSILW